MRSVTTKIPDRRRDTPPAPLDLANRDLSVVQEAPDPRVSFANERTFLAWNRTALALIAGRLAVSQLLKVSSGGAALTVALALVASAPACPSRATGTGSATSGPFASGNPSCHPPCPDSWPAVLPGSPSLRPRWRSSVSCPERQVSDLQGVARFRVERPVELAARCHLEPVELSPLASRLLGCQLLQP